MRKGSKRSKKKPGNVLNPGKLEIFGATKARSEPPVIQTTTQIVKQGVTTKETVKILHKENAGYIDKLVLTENTAEKLADHLLPIIDENFAFVASNEQLNQQYKVVAAVGDIGSGKSSILNQLSGFECFNGGKSQQPILGVQGAFATIFGENVLLLDCQPLLLPNEDNAQDIRDIHMLLFLLSSCDSILVVQNDRNRTVWQLVRYALLIHAGNPQGVCKNLILVQNGMAQYDLDTRATLVRLQAEWVDAFSDMDSSLLFRFACFGDQANNVEETLFLKRNLFQNNYVEERSRYTHYNFLVRKLSQNKDIPNERNDSSISTEYWRELWQVFIPELPHMKEFFQALTHHFIV